MRKAPPQRRVLLAEPESLSRDGLERLLREEFRVVGTVSDFESLRAATARLHPEVVVASLLLVLAHGVDGARALLATFHKYKTMRTLGLDSSAALVRYAIHNGML